MEPDNNANNINNPQVGPISEPLPPDSTPPAPVVPEPAPTTTPEQPQNPTPEPSAPTPAEPTPTSTPVSTPTPTPTPAPDTSKKPDQPKKESNKNNYILAGVAIGIIALFAVLIAGGLLGWFGDGFLGGSLFGGSTSGGSNNSDSGFEASIINSISGKMQVADTDMSNPESDAANEESLQVLKSALIKYQTNNMGNLPPIDESGDEYLYEKSTSETPLTAFYNDYLGDDFVDEWGYKPNITFYASPDADFGDYDYNNYSSLNYSSLINVYYNATCNEDGELESSTNSRSFAITIGKSDYSDYYCVSNN